MGDTFWLFLYLARLGGVTISGSFKRSLMSGGGWRERLKKLLIDGLLLQSFFTAKSLIKTYLKMRVKDVPVEVRTVGLAPELVFSNNRPKPYEVDGDFTQPNVFKNFKPAKDEKAKYKIVSFHNGPAGVSFLEILLIALINRWSVANLDELMSVSEACNFKALAMGDNHTVAALGTLIKRSSAKMCICCTLVSFYTIEKETTQHKRIYLQLHDVLFSNYPSGAYVLFRVN